MNKAKSLAAGLLSLGAVAATNAQQVVKRVTNNATTTIVELFVLRNGTSLPNTTGSSNFNTGSSDNKGGVIAYNPTIASAYDQNIFPAGLEAKSSEQVGNGTFPFNGNQVNKSNNLNFIADNGSGATLNMTIPQEDGTADSTQDNNTLDDMLYTRFNLPKTLNGGGAIPNGLMVICLSRSSTDLATGSNANASRRIGFQRNQATLSWTPIANSRTGSALDNLQEIGTNGQLGIEDFESLARPKMIAYPNPASDTITLDNRDSIDTDFDFEIYDITGRQVGTGQGKEGQAINIEYLPAGHYIIQTADDDGHRESKKIIKK